MSKLYLYYENQRINTVFTQDFLARPHSLLTDQRTKQIHFIFKCSGSVFGGEGDLEMVKNKVA